MPNAQCTIEIIMEYLFVWLQWYIYIYIRGINTATTDVNHDVYTRTARTAENKRNDHFFVESRRNNDIDTAFKVLFT